MGPTLLRVNSHAANETMCPVSGASSPLDVGSPPPPPPVALCRPATAEMIAPGADNESSESQYTECPVCGSLAERRHCFHYGGVCCYRY